jgi:hypothetical protein
MSTLAQTIARWSASANVEACFQPNRRLVRKSLAALQGGPMVKRIPPIRVICFCLLVACGALCQKSADLIQELPFDGSNSPKGRGEEIPTSRTLPDAPSVRPPTQAGIPNVLRRGTFAFDSGWRQCARNPRNRSGPRQSRKATQLYRSI